MKEHLINTVVTRTNERLEDLFVEGLRRKGFEFKDKKELGDFVSKHCRCEHTPTNSIYFLNNIPFMSKYEMPTIYEGSRTATISGSYTFL